MALVLCWFTGCIALKGPQRTNMQPLHHNLAALNGVYANEPVAGTNDLLWGVLTYRPHPLIGCMAPPFYGTQVELSMVDQRHMVARLYDGDKLVAAKMLKGKVRNNYFSLRRKVTFAGIPLLLMRTTDFKCRIGLSGDSLVADQAENQSAWAFLIAAGGRDARAGSSYPAQRSK